MKEIFALYEQGSGSGDYFPVGLVKPRKVPFTIFLNFGTLMIDGLVSP
jgi:hypothetical protein